MNCTHCNKPMRSDTKFILDPYHGECWVAHMRIEWMNATGANRDRIAQTIEKMKSYRI